MYCVDLHVQSPPACTVLTCMYRVHLHVQSPPACTESACMYRVRLHVQSPPACTESTCMYVQCPPACTGHMLPSITLGDYCMLVLSLSQMYSCFLLKEILIVTPSSKLVTVLCGRGITSNLMYILIAIQTGVCVCVCVCVYACVCTCVHVCACTV